VKLAALNNFPLRAFESWWPEFGFMSGNVPGEFIHDEVNILTLEERK
jgi:hypothetical protein